MRLTRMLAIWTLKSVLVMAPSHKDGGVGLRRDKIKSKVSKTKFTHARTNARTHTHTHTHTQRCLSAHTPLLQEKLPYKSAALYGTCNQIFVNNAVQSPRLPREICTDSTLNVHAGDTAVTDTVVNPLLANACTSPGLATEVMQFARLGSVNRRAEVMRYTVVYVSALTHQSACQLLCVLVCQAPPTRKNWFASFSISNPFKFPFLLDALFWLGVVILGWLANRELTIFLFRF